MAAPLDPTDPHALTPDQRLDELADLLARGVRRALSLRAATPPDSDPNGLDVSPEKSVHVPRG